MLVCRPPEQIKCVSAGTPDSDVPPATAKQKNSTGGEDVGLPLMLDSRFERDTLFLIFEEDFRFEPEETSGSTNLEPVAGQNSGAPGVGIWYEFPLGPRTTNKMLKPSQELMDVVQMATIASRQQAGELIWASWVPAGRKSHIGYGSGLVMLDPDGACKLAAAMQKRMDDGSIDASTQSRYMKPGPFDERLKDWLLNGQPEWNPIKYCYVYPPIGNYKTHVAAGEVGLTTGVGRAGDWYQAWSCPGTRKSQDSKGRDKYLAQLTKKGEPTWLVKFDLDQESARHEFTWCSS